MKRITFTTKQIVSGVNLLCDTLKLTIGPCGHNVIIDSEYGQTFITNDGFTISENFNLKDKEMNAGAQLAKDALQATNDNVGDGRTTCAVILQVIMNKGIEYIEDTIGSDPIKLREEIIKAKDEVISLLTPTECTSAFDVAKTSAKSDYIGQIVADALDQVGKDGMVKVEDGDKDEVIVVRGYEIDTGATPMELEDADIVVLDKDLDSIDEVKAIIDEKVRSGRTEILLIANDFSHNVDKFIKMSAVKFNIALIKSPSLAKARQALYEDIESITKGKAQVSITEDKTLLIGCDSTDKIQELELLKPSSDFDKEQLAERIAKLKGTIAVIRVHAKTNTERVEKKHHLKDAIKATQSALAEGTVKGGGLALANIKITLDTDGARVLQTAIQAPYEQIKLNGYNFTDTDVIDSYKVTRTALENAVVVATSILTTGAGMIEEDDITDRR